MLWFLRHYVFKSVLSLGLLAFMVLRFSGDTLLAGNDGQLAFSTPFDRKIDSTGLFTGHGGSVLPHENLDIRQIFDICRTFRYLSDSRGDHWQSAEETEARRSGDCEDKAVWLFAKLQSSGYQNIRLVVGKYRAIDRLYHVWVTVEDGSGNQYLLDPTKQKRIWTIGQFSDGLYRPIFSFDGIHRYRHTT